MPMTRVLHETRSETIFRHTDRMLHDLRISWGTFGQGVVDRYHGIVPEEARIILFKVKGDTYLVQKGNGQHVKRFRDGTATTRFPVDLEEAWVRELREPYLGECRADLAARYGLLAVPSPESPEVCDTQRLSDVTHSFGQMLTAVAPTLADNVINQQDLPYIPAAVRELDDLIAAAMGLKARYVQQLELAAKSGVTGA